MHSKATQPIAQQELLPSLLVQPEQGAGHQEPGLLQPPGLMAPPQPLQEQLHLSGGCARSSRARTCMRGARAAMMHGLAPARLLRARHHLPPPTHPSLLT
jgi:hypothetical protein